MVLLASFLGAAAMTRTAAQCAVLPLVLPSCSGLSEKCGMQLLAPAEEVDRGGQLRHVPAGDAAANGHPRGRECHCMGPGAGEVSVRQTLQLISP